MDDIEDVQLCKQDVAENMSVLCSKMYMNGVTKAQANKRDSPKQLHLQA